MMMSAEEMAPTVGYVIGVQGVVDFIAIMVGIIAIYSLIRLNEKLGGKLSGAIRFFNLGMAANVLAILWSAFLGHMFIIAGMEVDAHHFLMSIGMIFFILSTRKLSGLVQS